MNEQENPSEKAEEPVLESTPPSSQEETWFQYIETLPFESKKNLEQFADKLIGVNTALIAAYVAALRYMGHEVEWYLLFPPGLFFVSLVLSIFSMYPKKNFERYTQLTKLKKNYYKRLNRKYILVTLALILFLLGLIVGVLMLLYA